MGTAVPQRSVAQRSIDQFSRELLCRARSLVGHLLVEMEHSDRCTLQVHFVLQKYCSNGISKKYKLSDRYKLLFEDAGVIR